MIHIDYLFESSHPGGTYASVIPSVECRNELYAFCAGLGIDNLVDPDEYHCTIIYSKVPCPGVKNVNFELPFGAIMKNFKILGNDSKVLVMEIYCPAARALHDEMCNVHGAHHDYDSYIPHITIAKDFAGDLPTEIYEGEIEFTGMVVEELS